MFCVQKTTEKRPDNWSAKNVPYDMIYFIKVYPDVQDKQVRQQ